MDESARQSPEAYDATRPCVPVVDTLDVASDILHAAAPLICALELRLGTSQQVMASVERVREGRLARRRRVMRLEKLEIPYTAYTAGTHAAMRCEDAFYVANDVLDAAAPLIVAVELRRMAADLYRRSDNVSMSGDGRGIERVGTFREIADLLIARADELDGGV